MNWCSVVLNNYLLHKILQNCPPSPIYFSEYIWNKHSPSKILNNTLSMDSSDGENHRFKFCVSLDCEASYSIL